MCMFSLSFDQMHDLLSSVKHKKIIFEKCLVVLDPIDFYWMDIKILRQFSKYIFLCCAEKTKVKDKVTIKNL